MKTNISALMNLIAEEEKNFSNACYEVKNYLYNISVEELDGRVNIIVGTHTHVQTNDARVLSNGTMYMTDLGMTGALDGVIGVEKEGIIKKFLTGMPVRHNPMEKGMKQFCGLVVDIDEKTRKVTKYDIINMVE